MILMSLFAIGGTTYGMAEETLAFYALLISVVIAAGFDVLTGVAIILIGAGIGTLGSTVNPFASVIASNAAAIPFSEGMAPWLIILIGWAGDLYSLPMRYASRVKADPTQSVVAAQRDANRQIFLGHSDTEFTEPKLTGTQKLVLALVFAAFAEMIWGVSSQRWWMARMGAICFGMAIVVGLVARHRGDQGTWV